MEEVEKDPEEKPEPYVLSTNDEATSGVSMQELEEDTSGVNREFTEEPRGSQSQREEESDMKCLGRGDHDRAAALIEATGSQKVSHLQRDLLTLVTNIQTAADAKESWRRTELEGARRIRLERLENDVKSSQDKFAEISGGWSLAKHSLIPQELQEALNMQQQSCAELIEDKKKLIKQLQQELKGGDDRYVKDLRKQAEELDLMMERIEDLIKTLTTAYREELAQIESVYQQERDVLLTKDQTEWEQHMKELYDKQQRRLKQRRKKVEEYETEIHNLTIDPIDQYGVVKKEHDAKFQVLEREHQQILANSMIININHMKHDEDRDMHNLARMKSRIISLQSEMKSLMTKYVSQENHLKKKNAQMSDDYKRNIQQYERIQKKIKHFAVADARKLEEMWQMIEAEMKQLAEKALVIDSLICKKHLGLAWERPSMAFMELSGPIQPPIQASSLTRPVDSQKFPSSGLQRNQGMKEASVGFRMVTDEGRKMEMGREGASVRRESAVEPDMEKSPAEEETMSMETMKKLMELLCDESGFLMEDQLQRLLASMERDQQMVVKLDSLLYAFGLDAEDLPELADFLFKYQQQQREQTEDIYADSGESSYKAEGAETSSTTNQTSELIHPNHVLPALKSFLKHHNHSRRSSAPRRPSYRNVDDAAHWESIGNIISEDQLKLWDAAESTLKQYLVVLKEISESIPRTQSLKQQNAELRMLLQRSLQS